jgi:putative ABC transport system permease protein
VCCRSSPADLPRANEIQVDRWALAFTCGLSLLTGVAMGLMPARRAAARVELHETLKEGTRRTTTGVRRSRARGVLVVSEIALSLVLLVGAMLLIKTFANYVRSEAGFTTDHVLTAEIWIEGSRYDSTSEIAGFYRELTRRLEALPGVRSAAVVESGLPLDERGGRTGVQLDGEWLQPNPQYRTVTQNYFAVLGVPVLQGRAFTAADAETGEPVAVVNDAFARQYLDDAGVGHVIRVGGGGPTRRIVGIVGDVKSFIGTPAPPGVFIPSAQTPPGITGLFSAWFPIHVVARTEIDPAVLRDAMARTIRETDPQVPVGRVRTMDEVLGGSLAFERFVMLLLALFAMLAVGLAALGVYGVMSYFAAQRTHEIGVRVALGAIPSQIRGLVVGGSLKLTLIGLSIGGVAALAVTRVMRGLLFGVTPADPATYVGAVAVLGAVALFASWLPARRAARVDPMEALRYE